MTSPDGNAPDSPQSAAKTERQNDAEGLPGSSRSARLPPTRRAGGVDSRRGRSAARPAVERDPTDRPNGRRSQPRDSDAVKPAPARTTLSERLSRLSRLSMAVAGRTTLTELSSIAGSIVSSTASRVPPRFGVRVLAAMAALAVLTLLFTAALAIGQWRWLPIAFLFVAIAAGLAWGALRAVPKLADRFGERQLPGRAAAWFMLGFAGLAIMAWGMTQAISQAATKLGRVSWPVIAPYLPEPIVALAEKPPPDKPVVDEPVVATRSKTRRLWAKPGLLFMTPSFKPVDGRFDLILHFHGNGEIVKDSIALSKINALVHVTNLGEGSGRYVKPFATAGSLDRLIASVEAKTEKFGFPNIKVNRVAIMFWSAGYGAARSLLVESKSRDRVDAVLGLDGIHGKFLPDSQRSIHPDTLAPFVRFAEQAAADRKLMVLTHSAIPTIPYASTTESTDAILAALGVEREDAAEGTSPARVKFESGVKAFPSDARRWLRAKSIAQRGRFYVYGYAGDTKGDHIAHLVQLSETVLPKLKERWQ